MLRIDFRRLLKWSIVVFVMTQIGGDPAGSPSGMYYLLGQFTGSILFTLIAILIWRALRAGASRVRGAVSSDQPPG